MPLYYNSIINIISLTLYTPSLFLTTLLSHRHGLGHNAPYIFLLLFLLARLIQSALDLAATMLYPPLSVPNTALESAVAILTEIGLTPLLMSTISLLSSVEHPKGRRMAWVLGSLGVPLLVSLALIVAGGIDPLSREGPTFAATGETKAGVTLYCVCFIILVWCTAIISARIYLADEEETRVLTTVVVSLPFFGVVVAYYMAFAFEDLEGSQRFNVISGNETLQVCMLVVEEYVIVGLYLALGLGLPGKAGRLRNAVARTEYGGQATSFIHRMVDWTVTRLGIPFLNLAHCVLEKL
ncbi:MAG: hypothetical protein M1820_004447 [Bogoriella megaspora]|nr:MAG: hypothetical protein M1820_004447 [Bogoriella megaspora]